VAEAYLNRKMILPDKETPLSRSLLGLGAILLTKLKLPRTVLCLWEKFKNNGEINSYEKYIPSIPKSRKKPTN